MTATRRLAVALGAGLAFAGVAAAAEGLDRLAQIPAERRRAFLADLGRFDALPEPERRAIRELDRRVGELPPEVQARYRAVLGRYHAWLRGQPEAHRRELAEAPPERRIDLVRRYLAEAPGSPWGGLDKALALRTNLHPILVYTHANAIRTWVSLPAAERAAIQKSAARDRYRLLQAKGRVLGIPDARPPAVRRIEDTIREKTAAKVEQGKGRLDAAQTKPRIEAARRTAEAAYLTRNPPEPVDPARLDRLIAALPGWLLEPIDSLPPPVARRRLAVLYRLAFPDGELPEPPAGPAKKAARPAAGSRPAGGGPAASPL